MIYRIVSKANAQRLRSEGWLILYWVQFDGYLAEKPL